MKIHKMFLATVLVVVLLVGMALSADADVVTLDFTGLVLDASSDNPFGVSPGDTVTGSTTYDDSSVPTTGSERIYIDSDSDFALSVKVGSWTFVEREDYLYGWGYPSIFFEDSMLVYIDFVTDEFSPHDFGLVQFVVSGNEFFINDLGSTERLLYGVFFLQPETSSDPEPVYLDINSQVCPKPVNTKSKGVLPVAILGTDDFDVNDIEQSSIQLAGVAPLRCNVEDVGTPIDDPQDACEGNEKGPDGIDDLTLKFDTQAIVAALELKSVEDGGMVEVTLTGQLNDGNGTSVEGVGYIFIHKKGGGKP